MSQLYAVVVEDDVNLGTTFKMVLELCGFDVLHVNNSEFAMDKIIDIQPILVMLDLQMPKVSGLEILQAIRENKDLSQTKVIMLTANSYALRDDVIGDLADLVLLKPVSISQIQEFASRLTGSNE